MSTRRGTREDICLSALRALAYWIGAILPGVPRPLLALAIVLAAGLVARLLGERVPVWSRVFVIVAGAALGCLILAPMLIA